MNIVSKTLIFAAAAILGACSHYNKDLSMLDKSMQAEPVSAAASPQDIPSSFGATLARDYYDLARFENDKAFDYKAAKTYTEKAMAASKGQMIAPSRIASFDVPPNQMAELIEARQNLVTALQNQNTPGNEQSLAKAQTSFDCWLERSEEAADESHYASCKSEYEQAMAQLVMPAAGTVSAAGAEALSAPMTEVTFAPGAAIIDAPSTGAIGQVASFLTSPEGAGYTVMVTGFTNGAAEETSRKLATARALVVRQALVGKGVADARVQPQIASAPQQSAGLIPASMAGAYDNKVQIHLIAPVGATVSTTTVTTTTEAPAVYAPAPAISAPVVKAPTMTHLN